MERGWPGNFESGYRNGSTCLITLKITEVTKSPAESPDLTQRCMVECSMNYYLKVAGFMAFVVVSPVFFAVAGVFIGLYIQARVVSVLFNGVEER